jgi:hypothetical protein
LKRKAPLVVFTVPRAVKGGWNGLCAAFKSKFTRPSLTVASPVIATKPEGRTPVIRNLPRPIGSAIR